MTAATRERAMAPTVPTSPTPAGSLVASPKAAILTWLAVVSAAWALTTLFVSAGWFLPVLVATGVVSLLGIGGRAVFGTAGRTVALQAVGLVLTVGLLFPGRSTLFLWVLPTPGTVTSWQGLLTEGLRTLRSSPAPAPSTAGTTFLLVVALAALALAADALAVTLAMPALSGLSIAAPYLTAVANGSGETSPLHFIVPAAFWLLLLVEEDVGTLLHWERDVGRALPRANVPVRFDRPRWASGLTLGASALVLSVFGASYLPTLPTRYLLEGLGRGTGAGRTVGFSLSLDMSSDLRSLDSTPVLRYRTTASNPGPLRVAVSTSYVNGVWDADDVRATPSRAPALLPAAGLTSAVKTTKQTVTVIETSLASPNLATPYPLAGGLVNDAQWAVDPRLGVAVVDRIPASYELSYLELNPTPAQMANPGDADDLRGALVTDNEHTVVAPYLEQALGPDWSNLTSYERAAKIQDWLRSSAFTYDLTLAPVPAGLTPEEIGQTALKRFLTSKRGYCVQFTTAMVMMARTVGIPARTVTGFLPGSSSQGIWTVKRSDAHAWPELYFSGVGWVRFEPTPGQRSGAAPSFVDPTQPSSSPSATASSSTSAAPSASNSRATERPDTDAGSSSLSGSSSGGVPAWFGWAGAALVVLLLASLVAPIASRVRYRGRLARAPDGRASALVHWDYVTHAFADLGFVPPPSRSPRQQVAFYQDAAVLDPGPARALGRLAAAAEDARYAPPDQAQPASGSNSAPDSATSRDDVRAVLGSAGELRARRTRLLAWLWPSYALGSPPSRRARRVAARLSPGRH